jgi:hypothetical protein
MNNQEAKIILALFRPDSADEADPSFLEARQLAKTDPELTRWFEAHCQSYLLLRRKFQAIPVPPALKEQILSERKIQRPFFQRYWRPLLAMAAVVAFLAGIDFGYGPFHGAKDRYAAYRKRMVEAALRGYFMDVTTTNQDRIQKYLVANHAPADYPPSGGLTNATLVGCAVSSWQGNPVSMICFYSGRPLPPGEQSDLWLFITGRQTLGDAFPPAPPALPAFDRVNKAITASWSDGHNDYLLAAVGDDAFLKSYVPKSQ